MYLKWMLAHLKNIEWLCCYQGPVAYAHRQRSVALRAKTKQPYAVKDPGAKGSQLNCFRAQRLQDAASLE